MKISNETLAILKNFASINTNIVVREGSVLATVSEGKNILTLATVSESFPREFAVYDLPNLLALPEPHGHGSVDGSPIRDRQSP